MKYLTTILLLLSLPVSELHSFWAKDYSVQNWIIDEYRPMVMSWNLKFVEIQVTAVLWFAAFVWYRSNKANGVTVKAYFLYTIFDTVCYFYNYKLHAYWTIYLWFFVFWMVAYYWHSNVTDRTFKKINP